MATFRNPRPPKFTGQKFIDNKNKRNTKRSYFANSKVPKTPKSRKR